MPLMELKCKNCRGELTYDPDSTTHRILNCPYCNTPYVETEEINYNQYNTQIEHLHADVVQVNDDRSSQARLKAGNANLSIKLFNNALEDFKEASKLAPDNYLAWWGQIRAISHDFSPSLDLRKSELDELQKLFKYALQMAPEQEKPQLEEKFQSYINPLLKRSVLDVPSANNELRRLHEEKNRLERELSLWGKQVYSETNIHKGLILLAAIMFVICIIVALCSSDFEWTMRGLCGSFSVGAGLIWMVIIRPINNRIVRSKENKKQQQINALQQQLNHTCARIDELSRKLANWTS